MVMLQAFHRFTVDNFPRQAFGGGSAEEMANQFRNVLRALTQRRQPERHYVEPEEQVLAK